MLLLNKSKWRIIFQINKWNKTRILREAKINSKIIMRNPNSQSKINIEFLVEIKIKIKSRFLLEVLPSYSKKKARSF